jgi:hypothetical protein
MVDVPSKEEKNHLASSIELSVCSFNNSGVAD